MDYQQFKKDFEASGKTQAGYSGEIGISKSMVSYYLKKARDSKSDKPAKIFQPIRIESCTVKVIKIRTAGGIEIEIPI